MAMAQVGRTRPCRPAQPGSTVCNTLCANPIIGIVILDVRTVLHSQTPLIVIIPYNCRSNATTPPPSVTGSLTEPFLDQTTTLKSLFSRQWATFTDKPFMSRIFLFSVLVSCLSLRSIYFGVISMTRWFMIQRSCLQLTSCYGTFK